MSLVVAFVSDGLRPGGTSCEKIASELGNPDHLARGRIANMANTPERRPGEP
jgi:hypothetical protein